MNALVSGCQPGLYSVTSVNKTEVD